MVKVAKICWTSEQQINSCPNLFVACVFDVEWSSWFLHNVDHAKLESSTPVTGGGGVVKCWNHLIPHTQKSIL